MDRRTISNQPPQAGGIRHVVFDFDGTLSLIRAGWASIMIQQWLDLLPPLPKESVEQRREGARADIWRLNGKPSIHQAALLADRIRERGGSPLEAPAYEADYQQRLARIIESRLAPLRSGAELPDRFLVTGAREFLRLLKHSGIVLHLASGTVLAFVRAEARALQIESFFEDRIHGPHNPGDRTFSKRAVILSILQTWKIAGQDLAAFGDGHVEIEETKAVGGLAIAVASDEEDWRSGRIDEAKRDRLKAAGADFCVPDFRDLDSICQLLNLHAPDAIGES